MLMEETEAAGVQRPYTQRLSQKGTPELTQVTPRPLL